jgi:6-phosphogluconolactonase (cycloisomerase 2 family)
MGQEPKGERLLNRKGSIALLVPLASALLLAAPDDAWSVKGQLSFRQRVPAFDVGVASGLVASPDGKNLYATGSSHLTVLSRDATTGAFAYLETERDNVDDPTDAGGVVNGLNGARGVAISADGKNVYVAGFQPDNSVAVFSRDSATGRLNFVEVERDGVNDAGDPGGTVENMFRPEGVTVSPDGTSVYAVTESDNSVAAFERDPATGKLSYLETEVNGVNDPEDAGGAVTNLISGTSVTVAPDSEAVYATADTGDSVVAFSRNKSTGEISFVESERDGVDDAGDPGGTVSGLATAQFAAVSTNNEVLFASGFSGADGAIAVFARDKATEKISFLEAEVNGVDDAGDLGPAVSGLDGASGIALSADGANLYAADKVKSLATFRFQAATKELVFVESETAGTAPGDGGATPTGLASPRRVAVPPDGSHVYVASADLGGIAAFSRTAPTLPTLGRLGFLFSEPSFSLRIPRGVAITPDARHLLLTTLGDQSLRSFERDPATGAVQLLDTETEEVDDPSDPGPEAAGIYEPRAVAVAPNGTDVYVTDTSTYSVSLYRLDPATGELTYVESEIDGVNDPGDSGGIVDGLYEPWDVVVSPDGRSVYAPGSNEDKVAAFERDPGTGELNFVEVEVEGVGEVDGLAGVMGLAISPDGKSLYAAGRSSEEAAVFARDPNTGALTFLEQEEQGVDDLGDPGGAVDGFDGGPEETIVSPDGRQVYFVSSNAVTRFDRDPATGLISFAEVERDGTDDPNDPGGPVEGLEGATELALAADGSQLYAGASSFSEGGVVTFSRDPSTGALSFLELERNGVDDPADAGGRVEGLDGVEDLAVAPDDRHLYVAAELDNSLTIFDREDDFVAPETTITGGPAEGQATRDSTPSFSFSSSEPGSTFACTVDGATTTCQETLAALADGAHSFAVAARDAEGNADATPATRSFTVDTVLSGGRVKAGKKQAQKGKKIVLTVTLSASENTTGTGSGKVTIGRKSYGLKPVTAGMQSGKERPFKLKLKKPSQGEKIADALAAGRKVRAKLTGKIVDGAGNAFSKSLTVTLKRKR